MALVIKDHRNGKLYTMEATGSEGVDIYDLCTRLDRVQYSRIAVRHLHHEIEDWRVQEAVDKFMLSAKDKGYKQSWCEIMRAFCCCCPPNTAQDESSLFCSELVASFYIQLGVLKTDVLSNNYNVAYFASSLSDTMINGARLEQPIVIKNV